MATLPTLLVNADGTGPRNWQPAFQESTAVDEAIADADGTGVASLLSTTCTTSFKIQNMPGAFITMSTLSWRVRYASGPVDDILSFDMRIVSRTSGTILAAADAGGTFQLVETWSAGFIYKNSPTTAWTYVNTSATKAEWDDAEVEFRQTYTIVMADDGARITVDAFELTGTYVAATFNPNSVMVCVS